LVVCYVLIPGINDSPEDVRDLADLVKSLNRKVPVDVLAYSKLGADKWVEMGLSDPLAGVAPATQEQVERFQARLGEMGVDLYHAQHKRKNTFSSSLENSGTGENSLSSLSQ
jgi:pyruvate formate lyase activating enzyme